MTASLSQVRRLGGMGLDCSHLAWFQEVEMELARQVRKHGDRSTVSLPIPEAFIATVEEVGEVAKALIEGKMDEARTELIHIAACCIAMVRHIDKVEGR